MCVVGEISLSLGVRRDEFNPPTGQKPGQVVLPVESCLPQRLLQSPRATEHVKRLCKLCHIDVSFHNDN